MAESVTEMHHIRWPQKEADGCEGPWEAADVRQRPSELVDMEQVDGELRVLGDEIQVVIECAAETKSELKKGDIEKLRKCRRAR